MPKQTFEAVKIRHVDQAADRQADTRSRAAGYFIAFIAVGLSASVLGPTLPSLAAQTGSQLGTISVLFTAMALGYLLGSLVAGRLYDRVASHPVMAGALVLMAGSLALIPAIPWLWLMAGIVLLLGLATGAVDVGGNTLLVWVYGERVGPYMNTLHFFFGLGAFLSPLVVAQILVWSGGIAWAYRLLALLMLPAAIWLMRLSGPAAPARQNVASTQSGQPPRQQYVLLGLFVALFFLYVGPEAGFGGWIYSYAVALGLGTETTAAYMTSAFWGALTAGRLLGVPVSARVRPRTILATDIAGCLVSIAVIVAWPGSALAAWLGTCGLGFSMASFFPTLISLAERRMAITGQITGWFLAGSSLGGMTVPWLMGQLFASVGPRSVMVAVMIDLVAAVGVFSILLFYSMRSDRKALSPTEIEHSCLKETHS
jgi:FHS family Na+ dependent glucose MFS transporter 1